MFSGRKTVGAYRIRPDVREKSAASLVDVVVWFVLFAHVRAYAIRPYGFWLIAWGGWCGWFVWFAHVRAYAIRPYIFWLIAWGGW